MALTRHTPPMFDVFDDLLGRLPRGLGWPGVDGPGQLGGVLRVEEFRDGNSIVIRTELAGIDPDKDLEITVADGVLHISAERRSEEKEEGRNYLRRELRYGSFRRDLPLPEGCSDKDVQATYKDGVLEIRLPAPAAPEARAPRKIAVTKG